MVNIEIDNETSAVIRQLVAIGYSDEIRSLLLTRQQCELVKLVIRRKKLSTHELAKHLGVTAQNASAKLSRLFRSGYLDRETIVSPSGGLEYVYKPAISLLNSPWV